MSRTLPALRSFVPARRVARDAVGRPERPARHRWPAFLALAAGVSAVLVVVLLFQHGRKVWATIGSPSTVESVPETATIGLFAVRAPKGGLSVMALSRRGGRRCLSIQFAVTGQPGRSAETLGDACRAGEVTGRGLTVPRGQAVQVFAGGKLLHEVREDDLGGCGTGRNICAMAFDRHAERLPLASRKRESGEADRDDGLLSVLQSGGRASESPTATKPNAREVRFGEVGASFWGVSLKVVGKGEPTTAEAIAALFTRKPSGFAVLVEDERVYGSSRSLVFGADGAFVPD